ncbi:Polymorphic outer membrane protein G family [Chlamydia pneumoniae]|uniref:Polymorphic outer membrane protein G family n=1 Tax=Chlamydia pneumoniae TaxID=83558 RepID=A0A0F7WUC6_CHLPN|nr:Polymorphic outer membrane protein G family [Chlamydia pneumoniae]CRI41465.1 Polymorphic outer membrane protein G family [Chlamydia pneumoniae]CRI43690.1 Polymorphic outer membrane protein G family [Chlamydia pneumoniae]CRI45931.1 Polymorphic outer membrane protein G family [Chlamydia pneumoniae]CRI48224.1 Polymorphic outer membrane protein G family [Chlamydia pneumoniae]
MKSQFSWLVLSSTLACFTSCSTVFAATAENIGPSDSFDGSTNTGTYTPKNTTTGIDYTLTGDITLQNLGDSAALTKGCFSDTTESLSFAGKGYSLSFLNIKSSAEGAALSVTTDKNLSLTGFSSLTFLAAPSSVITTPSGKGAVKCGGDLTFDNNGTILFKQDYCEENGGAISTKNLSLKNSTGSISFEGNKSSATGKKGGAICATGTVDITNNTAPTLFSNNIAEAAGGAINSTGNCTITGNTSLVFSENSVTATAGNGGALSGDADVTISGNQSVTFSGNQAVANGGAIYAKKLTLASGGGGVSPFLTI